MIAPTYADSALFPTPDRLEAKLQFKQVAEKTNRAEAEKRKRDAEEQEVADRKKKAKQDLTSNTADEKQEEEKVVYKVAATAEEALRAGGSGEGFEMANGEADVAKPKVKILNKEWWKGTTHQSSNADKLNDGISPEEEARRGNWFCESHNCNGHENPKLYMKCQKCGATRRQGIEGYRPEMKSSAGAHARYDYSADNRSKMAGH